MGCHPVLDIGVLVRTMDDGAAWEMDADSLGVDTFLAASLNEGTVTDLTDLVEVTWAQGSQDASLPSGALPRPDAGTCEVHVWDPHLLLLPPPGNLLGGVRPGRPLMVYDRDTGAALWAGVVELVRADDPPGGVRTITIRAVDTITHLEHSGVLPPFARPAEPAADRVTWALDTYAPTVPRIIDPAAGARVSATEVGSTPWDVLTDAADAEIGWVIVLRDGTVVFQANGAGELVPAWTARWAHEERTAGDRPLSGELRVTFAPGSGQTVFTVVVHDTALSGTPGPMDVGATWYVSVPTSPGQYFQAVVDSVTPTVPHTTVVLTSPDGQHQWPGDPGRGTVVEISPIDFAANPPGTVVWAQPSCAAVWVAQAEWDLAGLRNQWHVRRRNPPDTDSPYSIDQHPSVGALGVWAHRWDDAPVPDVAGEQRLAAFGASLWGASHPTVLMLEANVTAAANTAALPVLMDLVLRVNQSNTITVHGPQGPAVVRVAGWSWTWTGQGGLSGTVPLARTALGQTPEHWLLGIVTASELTESTVLA